MNLPCVVFAAAEAAEFLGRKAMFLRLEAIRPVTVVPAELPAVGNRKSLEWLG